MFSGPNRAISEDDLVKCNEFIPVRKAAKPSLVASVLSILSDHFSSGIETVDNLKIQIIFPRNIVDP